MFPGFWDRGFADNFGFNGFTAMWCIYLVLVVFVRGLVVLAILVVPGREYRNGTTKQIGVS